VAGAPRPADNRHQLVTAAVRGRIAPARVHDDLLLHDRDGRCSRLPGTGGVHPEVHAGDPVDGWLGDHLMVGASIEDGSVPPAEPGPLHLLACIGNRVRDRSGTALGVVAGKRGGLAPGFVPPQLVSVEVPDPPASLLVPGSDVVVEACGRGLSLIDWPDVHLMNLSPAALDLLPVRVADGVLEVAVRLIVPSRAAGAGLGQDAWVGDIEIADAGLSAPGSGFCFGDLVALEAIDGRYGRFYRPGTLSVGLVSHGPSPVPGHGVGVTLLLAGPFARLRPVLDDDATLGPVLRRIAAEVAVAIPGHVVDG
jgi:hypothetical protein